MRKLVVGMFISLDGVLQSAGGPDEDRDGGFEHGGWAVTYFDDELMEHLATVTNQADGLLLGRKTYEMFAGSWPLVGDEDQIAAKLNRMPKYVVSRTLTSLEWNNSTLLSGDLVEAVRALKTQPGGEIQVHGSHSLVQALLAEDLVDEFRLLIFPVVLGTGKRLFGGGTVPRALALTASSTSKSGVMINTYVPAGGVEYGYLGPDEL